MSIDIDRVKAVLEAVITEFGNWDRGAGELKGDQPSALCLVIMLINEIDGAESPAPQPEWDGGGAAPAGWRGEANNGRDSDYFKVEVVGHHYKTGKEILKTDHSSMHMLTEKPDCWRLRPIRTPEQRQRDELKGIIADFERRGHDCVTDAILSRYTLEPKP